MRKAFINDHDFNRNELEYLRLIKRRLSDYKNGKDISDPEDFYDEMLWLDRFLDRNGIE